MSLKLLFIAFSWLYLLCVRLCRPVQFSKFVNDNRVSLFTGLDYWNGLLDWTTGLTQTAIKYLLSVEQKLKRAHSACYFANVGSLAGRGVFPSVSTGQRLCAYLINPVIYDLGILSLLCMLQNKGWSLASALNKCPFRSLHRSL